jgi:PD-(D/E)XK nuclease superfamily
MNTLRAKPLYEKQPDGKWAFWIDNSTLKDFRLCEQYFDYRHQQLIAPKGGVGSLAMHVGSWWSDTMEGYYLHIKEHGGLTLNLALLIASNCWKDLDMDQYAALPAYEKFGGTAGAAAMLSQYYETHLQHDAQRWKIIAAEAGFGLKNEVVVGSNDRVTVYWVGKPDLMAVEGGHMMPIDHKTVASIDSQIGLKYKPNPQFPGYVFAAEVLAKQLGLDVVVDRCVINICARAIPAKPRDKSQPERPRFRRVLLGYSPAEINEWRSQILAKVTRMREAIESGIYLWNENACHNMYFRPCEYRSLCSVPQGTRQTIIDGNYTKIERWIPYQAEEDE